MRVGGERIGEDLGLGEKVVHPLAAIGDGHDAGDDFAADGVSEDHALLSSTNVLAIGGVVGPVRHKEGAPMQTG